MPQATPTAELLFAEKDATPISTDEATVKPWSHARTCLQSASKIWLSTTRPDGHPHVMPVLLVWVEDTPCFTTRPTSRKARNLDRNPYCTLAVAGEDLDLVVEGRATRTERRAELLRVAAAFDAKYTWRLSVDHDAVHDHDLPGSPEYSFYQVGLLRAFGYGADGLTATRWRFG